MSKCHLEHSSYCSPELVMPSLDLCHITKKTHPLKGPKEGVTHHVYEDIITDTMAMVGTVPRELFLP